MELFLTFSTPCCYNPAHACYTCVHDIVFPRFPLIQAHKQLQKDTVAIFIIYYSPSLPSTKHHNNKPDILLLINTKSMNRRRTITHKTCNSQLYSFLYLLDMHICRYCSHTCYLNVVLWNGNVYILVYT